MKKTLMLIGFVLLAGAVKSQTKAKIAFASESVSMGVVKQNVPAKTQFTFTNIGKVPLILKDVQPTCGCTAADYTKTPVLPGKKGFISVEYNAATTGPFHKTITVLSNADQPSKIITLTGEVK